MRCSLQGHRGLQNSCNTGVSHWHGRQPPASCMDGVVSSGTSTLFAPVPPKLLCGWGRCRREWSDASPVSMESGARPNSGKASMGHHNYSVFKIVMAMPWRDSVL